MNTPNNQQLIELIYRASTDDNLFFDLLESLHELMPAEDSRADMVWEEDVLLRHFHQSARISDHLSELQQQKGVLEQLVNQMPTGIVILDGEGQVLFCNQAAHEFVGECLHTSQPQRLSLPSRRESQRICQVLEHWAQTPGECLSQGMLLQGQNNESLMALLSPATDVSGLLATPVPATAVGVLLLSRSSRAPLVSDEMLRDLYQLTPTELDVLKRLVAGNSVEHIAEQRETKVSTVRSHLKLILQKTNTRRQSELIALVLRSPMVLGAAGQQGKHHALFTDHILHLNDDRVLSYRLYGPRQGTPLVVCHSTLSCRLEAPLDLSVLELLNICLIVPERPGFGASDLPSYDKVSDWVPDLLALLDHLGLDKVYISGTLSGGAYALAAARLAPQRIQEVVLFESMAPNVREYKYSDGPLYFRFVPRLSRSIPKVSRHLFNLVFHRFEHNPRSTYRYLLGMFNSFDAKVLGREDVTERCLQQCTESTRQGVDALVQDIVLYSGEWGFDLSDIQVHCHIVYGETDPVCAAYAAYLRESLPNNTAHYYENTGFAEMMYLRWGDIVAGLNWSSAEQVTVP